MPLGISQTVTLDTSGLPAIDAVRQGVSEALDRSADFAVNTAQDNVRAQFRVTDKSAIIASIKKQPQEQSGDTFRQVVGSDFIGAGVHEYGATINAINHPYLMWYSPDYGWVRKRQVVIPARPYFGPAIEVTGPFMQGQMQAVVTLAATKRSFG